MELIIIRHGQSANNALANIGNREVDPPLTELGKRQAEVLAQHLSEGANHELPAGELIRNAKFQMRRGFGITSLFTSAMYRSLQTVQPVARSLELEPQIWVDLHEEGGMYLDHKGDRGMVGYPGRSRSEIEAEFPGYHLPREITESGWWTQGHEEMAEVATRANRVSKQLKEMSDWEEKVAIITHGFFIDFLLKALLGHGSGEDIFYRHHNTAISRLSMRPGERVDVLNLNRVDHLDPDMVS